MISKNTAILQSSSEVTQGHRNLYHSIPCLWFPISVPRKLSLKCTVIKIFAFKNSMLSKPQLGVAEGN